MKDFLLMIKKMVKELNILKMEAIYKYSILTDLLYRENFMIKIKFLFKMLIAIYYQIINDNYYFSLFSVDIFIL
jgi:hypothetical protein